jgi:hypothetical protein
MTNPEHDRFRSPEFEDPGFKNPQPRPTEFRASEDERNRALDAALAKYAAVEPRAGLEGRILARVRAEQVRRADPAGWFGWRWVVPVAAVFVMVLALAWNWTARRQSIMENHPMGTARSREIENKLADAEIATPNQAAAAPQGRMAARPAIPSPQGRSSRKKYSTAESVVSMYPKLDRFPSPHPLSDEERALRRYVRDFPQEALLTARAQEASEIEVQQKMNAVDPANSGQER